MNPETLLALLRLALRATEFILRRRAPQSSAPPTRVDKIVAQVAPLAERVLDQVAPETAAPAARRRSRSRAASLARAALVGAVVAGGAAYVVARQQRRVRERYRILTAPFPEELLDVLAAPGGGGRLTFAGGDLLDSATGAAYPVVDGIPDFSLASAAREEKPAADEWGWLRELYTPLGPLLLGSHPAGNMALAGAVADAAVGGWALSVPCGMGEHEIEMARANPHAHILCVQAQWNPLLEARRRALEAKIANLYFARGSAILLPLQDESVEAVWTANGFHLYTAPELAMTQIARVTKPGGLVAGVSLAAGGPRYVDALLNLSGRRFPGRRDAFKHFRLLAASGLRDLRAYRDGAYVRFTSVRE